MRRLWPIVYFAVAIMLSGSALHAKSPRPPTRAALEKRIERIEAVQLDKSRSNRWVRKELAKWAWQVRRVDQSSTDTLWRRWRNAADVSHYNLAMAQPGKRPATISSVEAETDLTGPLLAMMNISGNRQLRTILDSSKIRLPHQLSPEQFAQRDARRLKAWSIRQKHWRHDPQTVREAGIELQKQKIENSYAEAHVLIKALARKRRTALGKLTWDQVGKNLGSDVQQSLLRGAMIGHGNFFSDRRMPGMTFPRGTRNVRLAKALTVGGKTYGPGEVSLPALFLPNMEFMSPKDSVVLKGIEAHRRQRGRAGRNSRETFDALWALGSSTKYQHVHIPYRPVRRKDSAGKSVFRTDHWRRANLLGELASAVSEGGKLRRVGNESVTFFDYLHSADLARLNDHLSGGRALAPSELKMAAVGYRSGLYVDPATGRKDASLDGYEVRAVTTRTMSAERREAWLDTIQLSLATGHLGIARRDLQGWYAQQLGERAGQVWAENRMLGRLHYNRPLGELLVDAPVHVKRELNDHSIAYLKKHAGKNYGLKMLLHDWRNDTIWLGLSESDRSKALRRVESAQKRALSNVGFSEDGKVIRTFILLARLVPAVQRSLGFELVKRFD